MKFNTTNCKFLHVWNKNIRQDYFMSGTKLESAQVEKDLGVKDHQSFPGTIAVKKANRMQEYIAKEY